VLFKKKLKKEYLTSFKIFFCCGKIYIFAKIIMYTWYFKLFVFDLWIHNIQFKFFLSYYLLQAWKIDQGIQIYQKFSCKHFVVVYSIAFKLPHPFLYLLTKNLLEVIVMSKLYRIKSIMKISSTFRSIFNLRVHVIYLKSFQSFSEILTIL
jgi:hypothetical protein